MRQATESDAVHHFDVMHHFAGNVYAKGYSIAAGYRLVQHKHEEAHLSILAVGRAILMVDGERREIVGPVCVTIEANKHHGVKALTDCVWYCLHADDPDHDQIIEPDNEEMERMLNELL